jgi:SAM-dependent methyltransferase
MLSDTVKSSINKLFIKLTNDDEFEIMFNNYKQDNKLSVNDFIKIMKYMKFKSINDDMKLVESHILDISYSLDINTSYRVSIIGKDTINNFLKLVYQKKSNMIFSLLFTQYLDNENFIFIKKIKNKDNIIDIDEYDIRVRVSNEQKLTEKEINQLSKLSIKEEDKIFFRYKQRLSLNIQENFNIDLTIVKSSNNVNNINNQLKLYELEIDYSGAGRNNKIKLNDIFNYITIIKKILNDTDILLTKEEEDNIINNYKQLVYDSSNITYNRLYSMQPISAEVQHFVDNIPNKYSVTDKADGEKYQLYIYENILYLISNNLHVRKLNKTLKDYNNTVLEGEYVYLKKERKYLFMVFDCLYYKGEKVMNEILLSKRLEKVYDVCKKLNNNIYKIKDYDGVFNFNNIREHYNKEILNYYDNLNSLINKININDVIISPKIFLFPTGASKSEAFLYSDIIWVNCTKNDKVNCPYELDGIIYTGIEQKYTRDRKEQKYPTYKYKPPQTNSLDIYIEYEINNETGEFLNIFDNSLPDKIEYKDYRVTNVFVGSLVGNKEQPIPFMPEENNNIIYFPLINGQVRDIDGNIVLNKTVVEVIYNNNPSIPHQYRWTILRTRWDKTESVEKYKKTYGNYSDIAIKVWKSITEAITTDEIYNLSIPENYNTQMKILASRLNTQIINTERSQDKYYQKVTNLVKKFREFQNWIKSVIIYTYCSPSKREVNGKIIKQTLLDIGCGRGGDIMKFYHARVGEYIGFDVDYDGIFSSSDGAISRYNIMKSKYPDFTKSTFLLADGGVLLDGKSQIKAITNMTQENADMIDKIFTKDKKFDIISSQFVIHYLFGNNTSMDNMIKNINQYLRLGGYVLLTLFDGDIVHSQFGDNNKITSSYTDEEGQRNILFDIVKKYSGDLNKEIGSPIDVHMSWISEEGKYIEEYLVPKELMIKTMEKAGCTLIDTDLFSNIYNLNENYFKNVIEYEENPKNKQFYEKVAQFFDDNLKGADKESKQYSFLFRYYIFQKIK